MTTSASRVDSAVDYDAFWARLAQVTPKTHAFAAKSRDEWQHWRSALLAELRGLLGPDRPRTPLRPRVLERRECRGYVRELVEYDTEVGVSATAYVLVPCSAGRRPRAPGVVCLHGHGPAGKRNLVGEAGWNLRAHLHILRSRYAFAERLARSGYVCLCPDGRGWGDRADGFFRVDARDRNDPFGGRRDPCNVHFLNAQLYGLNLLWLNIWDDMRGVDYLTSRDDVDGNALGSIGFSWGGTRSMWLAALDERVRVAVVTCYLSTFAEYFVRLRNGCGSQILPGILRVCELGDVAALIAPRPLLCESGEHDAGFPIDAARLGFRVIQGAYQAAGVPERCEHAVFDGGHRLGPRALPFLRSWLPSGRA